MVWIFAILFLAVLFYILYIDIRNHLYLRKQYPEYMRDKDKRLKVGQVWIHPSSGTTYTITAISGRCVEYSYHSLPEPQFRRTGVGPIGSCMFCEGCGCGWAVLCVANPDVN